MPRNNNGTYTIPNPPFVVETAIDPTVMNNNFSDIAQALTQSVANDGQTPLTGGFLQAAGTAAAPSYSFADDSDEGIYHPAEGQVAVAIAGVQGFNMQAPSATVGAGLTGHSGAVLCPIGCIMDYAGTTLPTGWFWCNGAVISRAAYPLLFAIIGTAFGVTDGSSFALPDLRGRVSAGLDNMGGIAASGRLTAPTISDPYHPGGTGGNEEASITEAQMPPHTHTVGITDTGHSHTFSGAALGGTFGPTQGGATNAAVPGGGTTSPSVTGISASANSTGSGAAHNNTQPTLMVNKIIFAGVA